MPRTMPGRMPDSYEDPEMADLVNGYKKQTGSIMNSSEAMLMARINVDDAIKQASVDRDYYKVSPGLIECIL